jgi:hypothetical protein
MRLLFLQLRFYLFPLKKYVADSSGITAVLAILPEEIQWKTGEISKKLLQTTYLEVL